MVVINQKIYVSQPVTAEVPMSPVSIIPGSRRLVRVTAGTTRNLSKGGRVHGPSREDIHMVRKQGEGSINSTYDLHDFFVRACVERAGEEGQIEGGGAGQPCARRSKFAGR